MRKWMRVHLQAALHIAATKGLVDMARVLLETGANVNALDADRNTPLHLAAKNGRLECARALLLAGASANALNAKG